MHHTNHPLKSHPLQSYFLNDKQNDLLLCLILQPCFLCICLGHMTKFLQISTSRVSLTAKMCGCQIIVYPIDFGKIIKKYSHEKMKRYLTFVNFTSFFRFVSNILSEIIVTYDLPEQLFIFSTSDHNISHDSFYIEVDLLAAALFILDEYFNCLNSLR